MDDRNQELLEEVIEKEIRGLSAYSGKDKADAIDNLTQLYKLKIEEDRIRQEATAKDLEQNSRNKDRFINIGLQLGMTMMSLLAYNAWYNRGLKFQETGTFTDPMLRNLLAKLIPTRK